MDRLKPTEFHKEQLLARLFHGMSMEKRLELMRELPQAYNAYVGTEVVAVVRVRDVSPTGRPL
jgi:hypothetical protein